MPEYPKYTIKTLGDLAKVPADRLPNALNDIGEAIRNGMLSPGTDKGLDWVDDGSNISIALTQMPQSDAQLRAIRDEQLRRHLEVKDAIKRRYEVSLFATGIEGLLYIRQPVFRDERGFFTELYNIEKLREFRLCYNINQINFAKSRPGTLRGLHYQTNEAQAKIVSCLRGQILDVAVDLRKDSKTFGKHYSIILSEDDGFALHIPKGFAHGYYVLGKKIAQVMYLTDEAFNPKTDSGIIWFDSELNIDWMLKGDPIVSDKDSNLQSFAEFKERNLF